MFIIILSKYKLQLYQSCKEKMGGGGGAIACARQDQTQCHLCRSEPYLIFVIFFTLAKFLENKIYTEKTRKLRQNTQ